MRRRSGNDVQTAQPGTDRIAPLPLLRNFNNVLGAGRQVVALAEAVHPAPAAHGFAEIGKIDPHHADAVAPAADDAVAVAQVMGLSLNQQNRPAAPGLHRPEFTRAPGFGRIQREQQNRQQAGQAPEGPGAAAAAMRFKRLGRVRTTPLF